MDSVSTLLLKIADCRKHSKTHGTPLKCNATDCSGAFARNSDLRRHNDSVHDKTVNYASLLVQRLDAGICFSREEHLTQHLATRETPVMSTGMNIPEEKDISARKRHRRVSSDEPEETGTRAEVMGLRAMNQKLREIIKTLTDMQAV